ncbi:MAG: CPBP family intramembrane metalloprotease [Parachlamydiales bacterium]|nr:CPBP family intramembrane metalloprotease [Parachlamydiales bacterium]
MPLIYYNKPIEFFLITLLGTWIFGFIAAYSSNKNGMQKLKTLGIFGLLMPLIAALIMIYGSKNPELIKDFWHRLFLFKIKTGSLLIIFFLMPAVILIATSISIFFGKSINQFFISKDFNVLKGYKMFSILVPFLIAPMLEELGWRGYGIDSLRANFNLFNTSLIFGFLWGIWHLPLFFIKGYYQNGLWHLGYIYVINFFVSVFAMAFLTNWVYYTNERSIFAIILFHAILNISSIILKTEQFTKCIATILLLIISAIVVITNQTMFFKY